MKANTGDWLSFIKCQFVNGACPPVQISLDDLAALVNQPLADNCTCIDIDEADIHAKSVHTDESVRQEILRLSQCQSIAEFQRKDIGERKEICRIMKERGAGVRQLSRITGISLGTISKC